MAPTNYDVSTSLKISADLKRSLDEVSGDRDELVKKATSLQQLVISNTEVLPNAIAILWGRQISSFVMNQLRLGKLLLTPDGGA